MRITKANNSFFLHLRRGGVCRRINCHASNRKQAERNARLIIAEFDKEKTAGKIARQICEYAAELARGRISRQSVAGAMETIRRQAELDALDVIAGFFAEAQISAEEIWSAYLVSDSGVKPVTLQGKKAKFDKFIAWSSGRNLGKLRAADAADFLDSLGCSAQTRNNYISELNTVWHASPDLPNPWLGDLRKKVVEHAERKPADIDSLRRLLAWCDARPDEIVAGIRCASWSAFVRALYYSGLRPVDMCGLQWKELQGGKIELVPEKTSRTRKRISFVPDKKFFLCIPHDAIPVPDGFVFPDFARIYRKGRQSTSDGFRILCKKAGVSGLTLYQLRHNFVTAQINSGMAVEDVAAAVGHSATSTTEAHYYHGRHDVRLAEMPEI